MSEDERMAILLRNAEEVVTMEEAKALLARPGSKRAYVGIEPSGLFHIGQGLVISEKVKDLCALDFDVTILLADWHAFINDKLGRDMVKIKACGEYLRDCFTALGVDGSKVHFIYASHLVDDANYWERVLRVSKASTVSRIRRAMTIMGRKEDEADADASKLIYPAMQAADIFHMRLDLALGGMDQRHAHMLARDVADKLGWGKFVALHTPLLPSLQGPGRMDAASSESEGKMSKSRPETCVFLHDPPATVDEKISKAFCPAKEAGGNPVLGLAKWVVFPAFGKMAVKRAEKFGGDVEFESYGVLEAAYVEGKLHPMDLKKAVAAHLNERLDPVRKYLAAHPENLERVKGMVAA
jgi:tyrosyl-tRNA synthetase